MTRLSKLFGLAVAGGITVTLVVGIELALGLSTPVIIGSVATALTTFLLDSHSRLREIASPQREATKHPDADRHP